MSILLAGMLAAITTAEVAAKEFRFSSDPPDARLFIGDSPRGPWRLAIDKMPGVISKRLLRGNYFKAIRPPNRDSQPLEGNQLLELDEFLITLEPPPQSPIPTDKDPAPALGNAPTTSAVTLAADSPNYFLSQSTRNFAFVLAIEDYKALPRATNATRDANAIRAHLRALGYPDRNIITLLGSDASKSGIEKYLNSWFPKNLSAGDSLFVYFSGHGAPNVTSGDSYLVPWDGDVSFLEETAVKLSTLYESLAALRIERAMVVLDSCFSGLGNRSVLPNGARPLVVVHEEVPKAGAIAVLSAAAGNQIAGSDPASSHGLLTATFLSGLNERHGRGTLKDFYEYSLPRVKDVARAGNRDQTPQYHSTVESEFKLGRY